MAVLAKLMVVTNRHIEQATGCIFEACAFDVQNLEFKQDYINSAVVGSEQVCHINIFPDLHK